MRYVALFLLAGCATQPIPQRIEWPIVAYPLNDSTLNRPEVFDAFQSLLRAAGYGRLGVERAGFLVLDGDHFRLELWPPTQKFHSEEWSGRIPMGTVAVVHTHPPDLPAPSLQDRMEAQRVGLPIIVVTTISISVAMEDGRVHRLVLSPSAPHALQSQR